MFNKILKFRNFEANVLKFITNNDSIVYFVSILEDERCKAVKQEVKLKLLLCLYQKEICEEVIFEIYVYTHSFSVFLLAH